MVSRLKLTSFTGSARSAGSGKRMRFTSAMARSPFPPKQHRSAPILHRTKTILKQNKHRSQTEQALFPNKTTAILKQNRTQTLSKTKHQHKKKVQEITNFPNLFPSPANDSATASGASKTTSSPHPNQETSPAPDKPATPAKPVSHSSHADSPEPKRLT